LPTKWLTREGELHTVQGKVGSVHEVLILHKYAKQLATARLSQPLKLTDRGGHYRQHYDIGARKQWSDSFSKMALKVLGWSISAHGVRHSYAQERVYELQCRGLSYRLASEPLVKK